MLINGNYLQLGDYMWLYFDIRCLINSEENELSDFIFLTELLKLFQKFTPQHTIERLKRSQFIDTENKCWEDLVL